MITTEQQRAAMVCLANVALPRLLEEAQRLADIIAADRKKPKEPAIKLLKF